MAKITISSNQNENLLELIRKQLGTVPALCGGRGTCGKCKIQVLEGKLPVTTQDEALFTQEELQHGYRLACRACLNGEVTLRICWDTEETMEVQTAFGKNVSENAEHDAGHGYIKYGIAIDIGTTTLAGQLVSLEDGEVLATEALLNRQRMYGADVISRIQMDLDGKGQILTNLIRECLKEMIGKLCEKGNISKEILERITLAGNTTMIHLLMGYPCESLSRAPFTPYHIEQICVSADTMFTDMSKSTQVVIYPGISGFVGADIVSGICALDMMQEKEVNLLVDLGTNGEMALGNRNRLIASSTAAGPAFEGGNITWGTGSIPGAICGASIENGVLSIQTIQDQPAVGICGTGIVELAAELVKEEILDETGLLDDDWFDDGYELTKNPQGEMICLMQKDIREFQLAKAAIRGGIEALLHNYGIQAEDVDHVYVAGGFGYKLNYQKAAKIGMFPGAFEGKIQAVGNSSLKGAYNLLVHPEVMDTAVFIRNMAEEVDLASDPVFQNAFVEAMMFEEE